MKNAERTIPYCNECARKIKLESMKFGEFYCDVVLNTPMKGIVTIDTDGTECFQKGYYKKIGE